jgi:transposase
VNPGNWLRCWPFWSSRHDATGTRGEGVSVCGAGGHEKAGHKPCPSDRQSLGRSVFESALYVFSNRRRDRVRIVYWERNGLCLWSKRVEKQQFIWPRAVLGETLTMSGRELNALLDGLDVWNRGHRALQIQRIG